MRASRRIPILGQILILVLFVAIVALLSKYTPPSLSLVPPRVEAVVTLALALVAIILLIRRHLRSCTLPPDASITTRLFDPHLIAVLLTGASSLLTLSVASVVSATIGTLGLVGLATNVGRYPGRTPQNNRMLAWTVGGLLLLVTIKILSFRGSA